MLQPIGGGTARRHEMRADVGVTAGRLISSRAAIIVCYLGMAHMAWFLNFYKCTRCKRVWTDQWSCMCDDDCPHCGARYMSPYDSEELTTLIEREGKEFVVFWSPETAEHDPDYRELGRFPSREKALEFLLADG
jgi:Zn-finger nucleic acid-binding protein